MSPSSPLQNFERWRAEGLVVLTDSAGRIRLPAADGWGNILTGLGRADRDKRLAHTFGTPTILDEIQLDRLYAGDWRIARIVDRPASDQVRRWLDVAIEGRRDRADQIHQRLRELDAKACFRDGIGAARLHGTALGILFIDDGRAMDQPVDPKRIRRIEGIRVINRWEAQVAHWNGNPESRDCGLPEVYRLLARVVDFRGQSLAPAVHASRVLRWDGVRTSRRRMLELGGWADSVVARVYEVVRDWAQAIGGAAHLTTDFAQAVFRIKGLAKMLAEDKDSKVIQRLKLIDMARSIARLVPIDEGEDFERKPTPVTGLPELLDRLRDELVGAADIPEKILFGKATAGLGDQGQSDLEQYYASIEGEQERNVIPQATRLVEYLLAELREKPAAWEVHPCPLWSPSDKEVAENRLKDAQADEIRVRNSILTPDEIRKSRYGGDGYGTEISVAEPGDVDDLEIGGDPEDFRDPAAPEEGARPTLTAEQLVTASSVVAQAAKGDLPLSAARVLLRRGVGLDEGDIDEMLQGVEEEREERERKAAELAQQQAPGTPGRPGPPPPGQ